MDNHQTLVGVYAAIITPILPDGSVDKPGIEELMHFLSNRGCHGLLFLGTTGEGPSFSPTERAQIFQTAAKARETLPSLRLFAGTGTPSLDETVGLTRLAFNLGFDGVVVLPPYYFRKVSDEGLFAWFDTLINTAVPTDGMLLGYHIPPVTGVGFSLELLARLKDAHPTAFAGIKDSSADPKYAIQLGQRFGQELFVLTGNDRLFSLALENHASGCITAMANLFSPVLQQVWKAHLAGDPTTALQQQLTLARAVLDRYPPMPPLLKALLHHLHKFPLWAVRPPLMPLLYEVVPDVISALYPLSALTMQSPSP